MSSAYQNLPVWKKQLDLVVYLERIIKNFDRHHKYVIGSELRRKAHEVLVLLAKANVKASGTKYIAEAIYGFGRWGYFCPKHSKMNQFYQEGATNDQRRN